MGIRETMKLLQLKRITGVVIAPDIETISEEGLNLFYFPYRTLQSCIQTQGFQKGNSH